MTRTEATTYLTTEYQELALEAKFTGQQLTDAYNLAIDMSLRQLGVQETDLATAAVDQAHILGYLALLGYYALRRFERLLAIRVDVNIAGSLQAARSQAAKQIKLLLDDAKAECMSLGFAVGGTQAIVAGRLNLDFLEPWGGNF
jgi:hypothetical protein